MWSIHDSSVTPFESLLLVKHPASRVAPGHRASIAFSRCIVLTQLLNWSMEVCSGLADVVKRAAGTTLRSPNTTMLCSFS